MEFFKKTALAALVMGFSGAALALPNITILATGGTIAGGGDSATKSNYTAGKVGVENLVNAVPQLKERADVVLPGNDEDGVATAIYNYIL